MKIATGWINPAYLEGKNDFAGVVGFDCPCGRVQVCLENKGKFQGITGNGYYENSIVTLMYNGRIRVIHRNYYSPTPEPLEGDKAGTIDITREIGIDVGKLVNTAWEYVGGVY